MSFQNTLLSKRIHLQKEHVLYESIYSKSPTYSPSSYELLKIWTHIHVCNHIKLVHMSGVYCHMGASSTRVRAFLYDAM